MPGGRWLVEYGYDITVSKGCKWAVIIEICPDFTSLLFPYMSGYILVYFQRSLLKRQM